MEDKEDKTMRYAVQEYTNQDIRKINVLSKKSDNLTAKERIALDYEIEVRRYQTNN